MDGNIALSSGRVFAGSIDRITWLPVINSRFFSFWVTKKNKSSYELYGELYPNISIKARGIP